MFDSDLSDYFQCCGVFFYCLSLFLMIHSYIFWVGFNIFFVGMWKWLGCVILKISFNLFFTFSVRHVAFSIPWNNCIPQICCKHSKYSKDLTTVLNSWSFSVQFDIHLPRSKWRMIRVICGVAAEQLRSHLAQYSKES